MAVAFTACLPSASGVAGVRLQAPVALAGVVPTATPSTKTVTVLFGSPCRCRPACCRWLELSVGAVTAGAGGAVVSTVNVFVLESGLVLPTGSMAVAFTVCWPSASAVASVRLQFPPHPP